MLCCIAMPIGLSAWYSYTTDYQPQGRYLLPMLIPICYYAARGIQKGALFLSSAIVQKKPELSVLLDRTYSGFVCILEICICLALIITVYRFAFPAFDM